MINQSAQQAGSLEEMVTEIAKGLNAGSAQALKIVKALSMRQQQGDRQAAQLLEAVKQVLHSLNDSASVSIEENLKEDESPIEEYGRGSKITSPVRTAKLCNCPASLKRLGGKLVIVDCKGRILK